MQNKIANMEQQVLKTRLSVLQKQLQNLNFVCFGTCEEKLLLNQLVKENTIKVVL